MFRDRGQSEGDWEDSGKASLYASRLLVLTASVIVFYLHEGATLQNVIIGANQAEGVREWSIGDILYLFSDVLVRLHWMYVQVVLAKSATWD